MTRACANAPSTYHALLQAADAQGCAHASRHTQPTLVQGVVVGTTRSNKVMMLLKFRGCCCEFAAYDLSNVVLCLDALIAQSRKGRVPLLQRGGAVEKLPHPRVRSRLTFDEDALLGASPPFDGQCCCESDCELPPTRCVAPHSDDSEGASLLGGGSGAARRSSSRMAGATCAHAPVYLDGTLLRAAGARELGRTQRKCIRA